MKIFISYAKEDLNIAKEVYGALKGENRLEPWIDIIDLIPGKNWKLQIEDAIRNSSFFLPIISSNSVNKRGYVQKELKLALDIYDEFPPDDIFIIPLRVDDAIPNHSAIRNLQWVDIYPDFSTAMRRIIDSMFLNEDHEVDRNLDEIKNLQIIGFFENDDSILSLCSDGKIHCYDVNTGLEKLAIGRSVKCAAFSSSRNLVIYYGEGVVCVYDLVERESKVEIKIKHTPTSLSFDESTEKIVIGSEDGSVSIWSVLGQKGTFSGGFLSSDRWHSYGPLKVLFLNNTQIFLTYSEGGYLLKLWDIESDVLIKEFNTETEVGSACVSPSGELMAYSDVDDDVNYSSMIYVYETNNLKKPKSKIYNAHYVSALDINNSGDMVIATQWGNVSWRAGANNYRLWEKLENKYYQDRFHGDSSPSNWVTSVAINGDGRKFASCGDGIINIWNPESKEPNLTICSRLTGRVGRP